MVWLCETIYYLEPLMVYDIVLNNYEGDDDKFQLTIFRDRKNFVDNL